MTTRDVALLEVSLETPTLITRRIGKGGFYTSVHVIPGFTLLGAVARTAILHNVRTKQGNCARLRSPNQLPDCKNCSAASECDYLALWHERRIQLSDALPAPPGQTPALGEPNVLINLESIYEARRSEQIADGLLFTAAQKLALRDIAPRQLLTRTLTVGDGENGGAKKRPQTVVVEHQNGVSTRLETFKLDKCVYTETHVAINPRYRVAERSLLYSVQLLPEGLRFYATAIGDQKLLGAWFKQQRLRVGAGKSRGYGCATITFDRWESVDAYVERRRRAILQGFVKLKEEMSRHNFAGELQLGTITGYCPLLLVRGGQARAPTEALAERLGLSADQIIVILGHRGVRPRWDQSEFVITPSLNASYAAVFIVNGDIHKLASSLADAEVNRLSREPGYDWLTVNHPAHVDSQVSW